MAVPMNFVTFNQDHSCLAVGTHSGYRIYNCDPFGKVYENKEGDVSIIEMLFSTSLVALIFSPRRLVITNTKVRLDVSSVCNKKKTSLARILQSRGGRWGMPTDMAGRTSVRRPFASSRFRPRYWP